MTRKLDRKTGERTKSMAAAEHMALGTAAGAMALGVLATTDERVAAHTAAKDTAAQPQAHTDVSASTDTSARAPAPASDGSHAASIHADAAPGVAIDDHSDVVKAHDQSGTVSPAPEPESAAGHTGSEPLWQASEPSHMESAHDTVAAATGSHDALPSPAATPLDSALSSLNDTVNTLGASLHNVPGLPQVTQLVSETFSDVTHWTAAATSNVAGSLVGAVFDQPPHIDVPQMPLIDTSALVQTALAPLPLNIGFMGQPQPDPHDGGHDGAFSALGLHHF